MLEKLFVLLLIIQNRSVFARSTLVVRSAWGQHTDMYAMRAFLSPHLMQSIYAGYGCKLIISFCVLSIHHSMKNEIRRKQGLPFDVFQNCKAKPFSSLQ